MLQSSPGKRLRPQIETPQHDSELHESIGMLLATRMLHGIKELHITIVCESEFGEIRDPSREIRKLVQKMTCAEPETRVSATQVVQNLEDIRKEFPSVEDPINVNTACETSESSEEWNSRSLSSSRDPGSSKPEESSHEPTGTDKLVQKMTCVEPQIHVSGTQLVQNLEDIRKEFPSVENPLNVHTTCETLSEEWNSWSLSSSRDPGSSKPEESSHEPTGTDKLVQKMTCVEPQIHVSGTQLVQNLEDIRKEFPSVENPLNVHTTCETLSEEWNSRSLSSSRDPGSSKPEESSHEPTGTEIPYSKQEPSVQVS